MPVKPILNMVATVLDTYGNISDIILYEYRTNKCSKISYLKTVELLKSGICIGNLKVTKRNRLETFPKNCGFSRYCSFNKSGKIEDGTIHRVLISSHNNHNGKQYDLYNVKTGNCETVDRNFINSRFDSYNLLSNVIDIDSNKNMFNSYYTYKANKLDLDDNIEIDKFGNLIKCNLPYNISMVPDCIWVEKLNTVESDDLIVGSSVYGISHTGIENLTCRDCNIQTGVVKLEVEGIINCEFKTLRLPLSLHQLATDSIVKSSIDSLEIYGNTLIKDKFITKCTVSELIIHGKHIQFDKGIKKLVGDDCHLQYILIDKNLDKESSDILYNICNKDVIILTNDN